MELIQKISDFFVKYKSKLIILFIIFILMIYSILSMDIYLIIISIEIFLIYTIELITELNGFLLLGEKKLLELCISTLLLIIIFVVGYPLLDENVDNSIYKIFVLLYLNWYLLTHIIINYTLKYDPALKKSLGT